jgi:hypothetical protein
MQAEDIKYRWSQLGIRKESTPLEPPEFASWYPNAVSLTEVILTQRQQISTAGALTRDIAADGMARLQEIIPGLSPSLDFARNSV